MQKFITLIEWTLGCIAILAATFSLFAVMFTDNPNFREKLTPLQDWAFRVQGFWLLLVFGVFIGSFIMQYIIKEFPWGHVVGTSSVCALIYFYIFFSAYRH